MPREAWQTEGVMPETDEGVLHNVSTDPVEEQRSPPEGTHIWEASWSRKRAMMRVSILHCPHPECFGDKYEWWFKKGAGKPWMIGGNPKTGRMLLFAKAKLQHRDGHPILQLYKPTGRKPKYGEIHQCEE